MSTAALADKPFRMPVQWVNRPNLDFRGFSGTIVGGRVQPGDAVVGRQSGRTSTVARIVTMDGDLDEAVAGEAVTLTLADEIDISRGDVLAAPTRRPRSPTSSRRTCLWMAEDELLPGPPYLLKLGTAHGARARHRAQAQDRRQHARASGGQDAGS